jgi:hypothetical protein
LPFVIDPTLYPDVDPPPSLRTRGERIDYIARLCAAWDFGLLPDADTIAEISKPEWRDAVDACALLTSVAYHLVRRWHGLPSAPFLGQTPAFVLDDHCLRFV